MRLKPARRIPLVVFGACLLASSVAAAQRSADSLRAMARQRLAQLDGRLEIAGLDSAVEIRRDRWGVPHIYARTERDLFFAQGFVAAQDRLFQMDLWRRTGEGRLAEVLGPRFVARDHFARLLKYRGDMDAEWTSYAPDTKSIATSFVRGVNAYIALVRERPPVEFTILGYAPAPWSVDVPLQRMAALSMTGNAEYEAVRASLVTQLGAERVSRLLPTIPHRDLDPAPGLSLAGISPASMGAYGEAVGSVMIPRVVGSNNWVVSGALTKSGKPLLANDPHRYLDNPSLRYLSHLVGPGWNVIGAGEPAVPGVAAGHNERIGFGFTIVGMDQQDLYVETLQSCAITGGPAQDACYLNASAWKPVRRIIDTIPVKGEAARIDTLEFTEHGPIIAISAGDHEGVRRGFALRFVGSEPGTAGYLAQLSVDRAANWTGFLGAAARWKLPTENLIYADVDGNIGWIAAGLMPKRSWSGLLPVPGTGGYEWAGFRRSDELPQAYNPARGFIVTANHDIRPPLYDVPLNYEFATPFRAARITEVLSAARDSLSRGQTRRGFIVRDFQRLQHDELSLQARALVPELLAAAANAGKAQQWEFQTLRAWDFVMRQEAAAPLLFEVWRRTLSSAAIRALAGAQAAPMLGDGGWLDDWASPDSALALLPAADRENIMVAAMDSALSRIRTLVGPDRSAWRWGALHKATFDHRIAAAFDPSPVSRGGDGNTVNSTAGYNWGQQYGASFREILDLSDWDNSVATSVPGQSGQPGSEFYANLLPLWGQGQYFPLVYSRAAVERETSHVLWLTPQPPVGATR